MDNKTVNIHLNDETGTDLYSVERTSDPGNWLDSFHSLEEAEQYIMEQGLTYEPNGFYDTRYQQKEPT